jgi:CRP-like cAMP-binding protein
MFGALGATRGEDAIYPAMAQTLECSTAIAIPSQFLRDMMETRSYLSFDLMNLMTTYIQELQTRYREIATNRVEQRIANALIRLTQQSGIRPDKDSGIELFFSRKDVAEMTGATVFTVSRMISEWERKEILKAGRERIQILNPHALIQIADGRKE